MALVVQMGATVVLGLGLTMVAMSPPMLVVMVGSLVGMVELSPVVP